MSVYHRYTNSSFGKDFNMKLISRILATIITIVFIAYSFSGLFVYSTIHSQTHTAYTSFVENYYNSLSDKVSELIKQYTSFSETQSNLFSDNENVSILSSPSQPEESLDTESIIEILKQIIIGTGADIDIQGIINGDVSKEEISNLIDENEDLVDSIIKESCEKMNITQSDLISNVVGYLSSKNGDTEPLKNITKVQDLLSFLFSSDEGNSTDPDNQGSQGQSGNNHNTETGSNETKEKLNELKNLFIDEFKELIRTEEEGIAYKLANEEAQKLLTVVRDFLIDERISSMIDSVIDNSITVVLSNNPYELSTVIENTLSANEENINNAFDKALEDNDTTYPEFILILNEVMANTIPGYNRIDVVSYSTFYKVLINILGYFKDTINDAVDLPDLSETMHTKVPPFLLKTITWTYGNLASNHALFFMIILAGLILLLLCLISWSIPYGLLCGAVTFAIDGSILMFISSHPSMFSSYISDLPDELHAGVVLLLESLSLSWHVTGIWALSISAILLIAAAITGIIKKMNTKNGA